MNDLKEKHENTAWRALQIYTVYRICISGFLMVIFNLNSQEILLGKDNPLLFHWTSVIYFVTSVFFFLVNQRAPNQFKRSVEIQVFSDIVLVTLLMHASGGVNTGLGMLMAVSTTTACLLIERNTSIIFAALATVAVIGEAINNNLSGTFDRNQFTQAGLLGASFFATAIFALLTSRRLKQSEIEAELTSADLASMEKLNEKIIQFMKTGVIVIDSNQKIQFINTSAWQLLEMPSHIEGEKLDVANSDLNQLVEEWKNEGLAVTSFRPSPTSPKIQLKFSTIDEDNKTTIIFLEDTTPLTQQAQNLKLASLGRLTASIAHEIRNPLGALSHAAQLINESPDIVDNDKKLVDIIEKNALRVNTIIENILQLSQRKVSAPQRVRLLPLLESIIEDLKRHHQQEIKVVFDVNPNELEVLFDLSQLHQVVTNLAENGLRYSLQNTGYAHLSIIGGVNFKTRQPFLDIIDKGEGIEPKTAEKIFEPFFTTSRSGTGLGLYVSKELCEANRAQLDFIPVPAGGSCFRISFTREQVI